MSKRSHSDQQPSSGGGESIPGVSAPKRPFLSGSELVLFSRVRSLEELDKRTLQLQNKKLYEALTEKRSAISDLRHRIEQLENRQAKDDALLCVVNRYWNQLDEDCLLLLQRCEVDVDEKVSNSAESFLKQLASWEKEEVPEKLQQRVHFSKRIIARLLNSLEKLFVHQSRLRSLLVDELQPDRIVKASTATTSSKTSSRPGGTIEEESMEKFSTNATTADDGGKTDGVSPLSSTEKMIAALREEIAALSTENDRLQCLCTSIHANHRQQSLRVRELQDQCQANSDAADEWKAKYEDLEYKLQQSTAQLAILDHRLYDAQQSKKLLEEELAALKGTSGSPGEGTEEASGTQGVTKSKYNDMLCELEEQRELAANRLTELERLQRQHEEKVAECAKLSMQVNDPPEQLIQESPSYKSLKVQFNILYGEVKSLRSQLEESRSMIQTIRNAHLKQIEEMEANETAILNQMRGEMLAQEELYSKLRREFEIIEADFKQTVAHNEQAGPINSEMRSLITTLQLQNKQLKNEVVRYRRKSKEAAHDCQMANNELKATEEELSRARASLAEATAAVIQLTDELAASNPMPSTIAPSEPSQTSDSPPRKRERENDTERKGADEGVSSSRSSGTEPATSHSEASSKDRKGSSSSQSPEEIIRDLRNQLKISQEAEKEMSVLLSMYKVIPKDQRDKATLLQVEAKLRAELSEARSELATLQSVNADLQARCAQLQREYRIATSSTFPLKRELEEQADLPEKKVAGESNSTAHYEEPSPREGSVATGSGAVGPSATNPSHQMSPLSVSTCMNVVSPESGEKSASAAPILPPPPPPPPPTPHPLMPPVPRKTSNLDEDKKAWQVAELQQELQHTQRRCHTLEQRVSTLQQHLVTAKQQEDVMLKEMEVTGQAFEDVQEQNSRLLKSLREKDDANLNQMTEWMKTSQLARLLKEEKKLLDEQVRLMQAKIEALTRAIQKQEDKERLLLTNLETLEKEAASRQQSQEAYKRKSVECQQREEDLRVTVQKYLAQLNEAQTSVQEKASAYEQVSFRHQRLQEEYTTLKRKYERLRKIEQSHNADEVLLAEIQDYKEQLACPTCKTHKKDAILTKCFHVFCLNCLKTRYETRNRKCPKCNATFGANDYHRIYLT
ncbi:E3 ubiquitin protein ligase Bre1 [Echinococcus multilocularis]|uniref:E3 ubiquitin protein ligase n=1 Tax=Echinococcus multilocularis TaxID=6211 RepID=A0A068YD80_ECHMU|nr:E3 ubiquitin protein ligase Bre1 [Echinococcus multilocularis]